MKKRQPSSKISIITLLVLFPFIANASDYYWIGGNGNWSEYENHWATTSGGTIFHEKVPSSIDNVFFDANSFNSPGETVTVDVPVAYCNNMTWTGVTDNASFFGLTDKKLRISGSFALAPTMSYSFYGLVFFEATTVGNTITSAGHTFLNDVTFNGPGGEWILQDALSVQIGNNPPDDNHTIYFNEGSLNTNGKAVSVDRFLSQTSAPRSLIMGSSVFNIAYSFKVAQTGMTLDPGTSVINITGSDIPGFDGAFLLLSAEHFAGCKYS